MRVLKLWKLDRVEEWKVEKGALQALGLNKKKMNKVKVIYIMQKFMKIDETISSLIEVSFQLVKEYRFSNELTF